MESKELRNQIQSLCGYTIRKVKGVSFPEPVVTERQMDEIMAAVTAEVERAKLEARLDELKNVVIDTDFLNSLATDVKGKKERIGTRIRLVRLKEELRQSHPQPKKGQV